MTMTDVDLFVIGGGSGGVRAARIAAGHGAKVAITESSRWGGTCVIRGCVPKKLLVTGASVAAALEDARGFGWQVDGAKHDWATMIAAVDREVERLSAAYVAGLERAGVARIDGRATLLDATTVAVGAHRWRAQRVLIATGGAPHRPAIPGADALLSSDDVFLMKARPQSLIVIGGGYIGVEMAHIFAALGTSVELVTRSALPLRGFDPEVREACADHLRKRGVKLHLGREPVRVEHLGSLHRVTLDDGTMIVAERALAATGRLPNTAGLGLDAAGVQVNAAGAIPVDEWQRTSAPTIFAVGDVTGRIALTPVAIREGHAFADTVFGGRPTAFVHNHIPTAVFAQPPIACIGLGEDDARRLGDVAVYRASFRPLRHGITGRDERVLVKLVVDARTRKVLGLHMVGDDAPEIVQAAAIAITMGATKEDFDRTVALHPTAAEELVLLR